MKYRIRNWIVFLFSFLFCIIFISFALIYSIPSNISFIDGKEQKFDILFPLTAEIETENVAAVNVNNKPVENNIKVTLDNSVSVKINGTGNGNVTLSAFGVPIKKVNISSIPDKTLIPGGKMVGISVTSRGLIVLGTGNVVDISGNEKSPCEGILKSGDLILSANQKKMNKKEDLINLLSSEGNKHLNLVIQRNDTVINETIVPVLCEDNVYKLGAWVRDSTQGIGTLTYVDEKTYSFGALGHGIYDVDTGGLIIVNDGIVTNANPQGILKGEKGSPGEILGKLDKKDIYGEVYKNSNTGVYGKLNSHALSEIDTQSYKIALKNEVTEGEAYLLTDIVTGKVEKYKINISNFSLSDKKPDKSMVVEITDKRLLDKTGGIVQGMSGSPIVRDDKFIGALTHVFVNDPTKGYGIFIENMMNSAE